MFSPIDLQIDFDLGEYQSGINLLSITKKECPKKGYIYIPKLMNKLSSSQMYTKIVRTNGLSIFKNTEGRPSISSLTLTEKNYIESYHTINYSIDAGEYVRCSFLNSKISKLSFNKGDSQMYYKEKKKTTT